MCFSATASFSASAILGMVGVATLAKTKNKKAWLLAAMPILFAIQQFTEGLLWLSITDHPNYTLLLTRIFLFFAFLLWPIYAPLMALLLEPQKIRQRIMLGFCVGGLIVGVLSYTNFLQQPEVAQIINRCLFYPTQAHFPNLLNYFYILFTIGAGAVSSRPIVKLFFFLVLIFALFTWLIYAVNFVSVWCFFAAILSTVLYFYPQKQWLAK